MARRSDFAGCSRLRLEDDSEVEIGWWLARRCWGKGLATEAAQSVLRYAFERAGLARVIAIAMPENLASRRIMEKIGMRYESETEHKGFRVVLYSASRGLRSAVQ